MRCTPLLSQVARPSETAAVNGISWRQVAQYMIDSTAAGFNVNVKGCARAASSASCNAGWGHHRGYASKPHRRHGEPGFDPRMLPADQARLESLHWPVRLASLSCLRLFLTLPFLRDLA